MVIADQHDFYYQEYGDTRDSLEAAGVEVVVAATTTSPSFPHPNTGQGASDGMVVPDIALSNVNPSDYSAITLLVAGVHPCTSTPSLATTLTGSMTVTQQPRP